MKLRYLDGEKVYVEEKYPLGISDEQIYKDGMVQVCKHQDIIKAINDLFWRVQQDPENVGGDLFVLISTMNQNFKKSDKVPIAVVEEKSLKFNDPTEIQNKASGRRRLEEIDPDKADRDYEELTAVAGVLDLTLMAMDSDMFNGSNLDNIAILLRQTRDRTEAIKDNL